MRANYRVNYRYQGMRIIRRFKNRDAAATFVCDEVPVGTRYDFQRIRHHRKVIRGSVAGQNRKRYALHIKPLRYKTGGFGITTRKRR